METLLHKAATGAAPAPAEDMQKQFTLEVCVLCLLRALRAAGSSVVPQSHFVWILFWFIGGKEPSLHLVKSQDRECQFLHLSGRERSLNEIATRQLLQRPAGIGLLAAQASRKDAWPSLTAGFVNINVESSAFIC